MDHSYTPEHVCPIQIDFKLDGDVVTDVRFTGGCNGNLKMISKLIDGWTVDQIEEAMKGNTCGRRPTSCSDQLAIAVRAAYEEEQGAR